MNDLINVAKNLCDSVVANRIAHNARNEQYHFLMAINAFGMEAVVHETQRLLMERGYDYLTSMRLSIERVSYMAEVANGTSTFQNVRKRLRSDSSSPVDHTSRVSLFPS